MIVVALLNPQFLCSHPHSDNKKQATYLLIYTHPFLRTNASSLQLQIYSLRHLPSLLHLPARSSVHPLIVRVYYFHPPILVFVPPSIHTFNRQSRPFINGRMDGSPIHPFLYPLIFISFHPSNPKNKPSALVSPLSDAIYKHWLLRI